MSKTRGEAHLEQLARGLLAEHPAVACGVLDEIRRVRLALVELLDGRATGRELGVVLQVLRRHSAQDTSLLALEESGAGTVRSGVYTARPKSRRAESVRQGGWKGYLD